MMSKFSWEDFNRMPLIGIMRNFPEDKIEGTLEAFYKAGLTTIELTMNSPNAGTLIEDMAGKWGDKLNIGAGTVCNLDDLELALAAGSQFIVTPVINEEVIRRCVSKEIPIFPGAYTPSEIYKAWSLGASMVKVFPASKLGPGYIKEVLQPLNKLKLVATGGVSPDNFLEFFTAGVKGVGMGGNLFPKLLVENEEWNQLFDFFAGIVNKYNEHMRAQK
jgi:2-dehydro-3-deoxyphosphogluconate aldolase/(4S)-4-hydroxy-2-oxoglutarate aldolase